MATSIQRLASSTASDLMTTTVTIPNNEIKGKIIGKEGRNIRAFERAAGVELIVDAFILGPQVKILEIQIFSGGAGVFGMDVQVCDEFHDALV